MSQSRQGTQFLEQFFQSHHPEAWWSSWKIPILLFVPKPPQEHAEGHTISPRESTPYCNDKGDNLNVWMGRKQIRTCFSVTPIRRRIVVFYVSCQSPPKYHHLEDCSILCQPTPQLSRLIYNVGQLSSASFEP